MGKKTSIYLTDEIRAKLRCPPRGPSQAIAEIAERYDALLAPERKRLEELFSAAEWNALYYVGNGTAWSAATIRGGVLADIEDLLDSEIETYGAERAGLEGKLRGLSVVQQFALVEMLEAYWDKISPASPEPED